jgi:hypothetical protein
MTGTELALIKNALNEAERVSRFGIEVLDEADHARDAEPAENSRLRLEIDALAMREASLRSLQKTMSEIDRGGKPAPPQHPDIDSSGPILTSSGPQDPCQYLRLADIWLLGRDPASTAGTAEASASAPALPSAGDL